MKYRIGLGFDLHRLEAGVPLVIGGIEIPHETGLAGHSDGDVLCHAITDALLGAAAAGNIGEIFPDTDPRYRGMSSLVFLVHAVDVIRDRGYQIGNIDANVLAETPKLAPFFPAMKEKLALAAGVPLDSIHVKAKTMEGLGVIGARQAIAAEAVALLFAE